MKVAKIRSIHIENREFVNFTAVLKLLMAKTNINAVRLADMTEGNKSTIYRWLETPDADPNRKLLEPIANFFNITVEQLRGYQPIPGVTEPANSTIDIPVLSEKQIEAFRVGLFESGNADEFVKKTIDTTQTTFAYIMPDDSMSDIIPAGTTLLIDCKLDLSKYEENKNPLVLVQKDRHFAVRQQFAEMGLILYRPTNPNSKQLDHTECKVVGHIISSHQTYYTKKAVGSQLLKQNKPKKTGKVLDYELLQQAKGIVEDNMKNNDLDLERRDEYLGEIYNQLVAAKETPPSTAK